MSGSYCPRTAADLLWGREFSLVRGRLIHDEQPRIGQLGDATFDCSNASRYPTRMQSQTHFRLN